MALPKLHSRIGGEARVWTPEKRVEDKRSQLIPWKFIFGAWITARLLRFPEAGTEYKLSVPVMIAVVAPYPHFEYEPVKPRINFCPSASWRQVNAYAGFCKGFIGRCGTRFDPMSADAEIKAGQMAS